MTREEYKTMKESLKSLAQQLRSIKPIFKDAQRNKNWREIYDLSSKREGIYRLYRIGHVFMCLVRGRTRSQIEWNYESRTIHWLESGIGILAGEYGYMPDLDEEGRIIGLVALTNQMSDQSKEVGA